jgi:hypothetical protein
MSFEQQQIKQNSWKKFKNESIQTIFNENLKKIKFHEVIWALLGIKDAAAG